METLETMRLFVRIAHSESLSAAGRAFGLSPATVSRRVNALESEFGVRLINRTSRRHALTEAGQLYLEKAARILADIDALAGQLSEHQTSPRGLLHVHTRVSVGRHFLAPLLPEFLTRYPEVTLKLWLTEESCDLVENGIDVAIRLGNLDEPLLAMRKLADASERILFASPAYVARHAPVRTPEDLLQHNCLTWPLDGRHEEGDALWQFRGPGGRRELRVSGSLQVNNGEVLREAALAGLGIALLPVWCVAAEIATGQLIRVLPDWQATPTTFDHCIYAVYQRHRHVSPKVRALVDFLAQSLRLPAGGRDAGWMLPAE
jgi:DNA-binding transcriptional LysR family regulator